MENNTCQFIMWLQRRNHIRKKRLFVLLGFFSLLVCDKAQCHQDFFVEENFGNVKMRIKTGFFFEEIQKVKMFGLYAQKLSEQLNYEDTIFLDFVHNYGEKNSVDAFVSYNRGKVLAKNGWGEGYMKGVVESNSIIIRQIGGWSFNLQETLKLVAFAIVDKAYIIENQSQFIYKKNYCDWILYSVDLECIQSILNSETNSLIQNILCNSVYVNTVNGSNDTSGFTYFLCNNEYYIEFKYRNKKNIILVLADIYQFEKIGTTGLVVFDSKKSFYYFNNNTRKVISKKMTLDGGDLVSKPYEVSRILDDKIIFRYSIYTNKQEDYYPGREALFIINEERIINDFRKFIHN